MNIDDLSKLIDIMKNFSSEPLEVNIEGPRHIGEKVIIRGYASGVHYGELVERNGREVELKNARRLWKWHAVGGISLSEVARNGIDQSKSRICDTVKSQCILDALEIIPVTKDAISTIESAPVAEKS